VNWDEQVEQEGEIGRLQVKGAAVMAGYYRDPELNAQVFSADGWFNTGDLAMLRDGRLTITGREKDTVIINGVNYHSHDLEALVEEIEGVTVSFTAACGVRNGSDTDQLAIFFNHSLLDEGGLVKLLGEIRRQVAQQAKVFPDYLLPLPPEKIPKTAIGKIQRAELKRRFEAGEFAEQIKQMEILCAGQNTLPDWFYQKVWRRKKGKTARGLNPGGRYLLFVDKLGLGMELAQRLEQLGCSCVVVESAGPFERVGAGHYRINGQAPGDYQRLLESLAQEHWSAEEILHFGTYQKDGAEVSSVEALRGSQEPGLYSLLFLIQALTRIQPSGYAMQHIDYRQIRLRVISSHAQPARPRDRIAYEKGTLPGLLKTVGVEVPWLQCSHVDLETGPVETNASHILNELRLGGQDTEIAYRQGRRLVATLAKMDLLRQKRREIPLERGGIYLLSGGLGGIGAWVAEYLMKHYQARLIIVGRTVLPERTQWAEQLQSGTVLAKRISNYLRLESCGEFIYEPVDVCDLARLQTAVSSAEARWQGKLSGVLHLAGVLHPAGEGNLEQHWKAADQYLIAVQDPRVFEWMFGPKVYGTWTLLQLVRSRPEAIFVAFSSINSLFGGATFSAYSAANSFVDSCCYAHRHGAHRRTYCFNWSIWEEVGMSQGNSEFSKEAARRLGYQTISKEQGLHSLMAGLSRDVGQLIVGLDGANRQIRRQSEGGECATHQLTAYFTSASPVPQRKLQELKIRDRFQTFTACQFRQVPELPLTATGDIDREKLLLMESATEWAIRQDRVAPRNDVERQLARIWQELLRVSCVGIHDNFFELGGHSLLATRLIARVRTVFEVDLTPKALFENPTVAGLSEQVDALRGSAAKLPASTIQRVNRAAPLPLSHQQEQFWFLCYLLPGSVNFDMLNRVPLTGALDVTALERAFNEVIRRHEVLRTTFRNSSAGPVQSIHEHTDRALPLVDLHELAKDLREEELRRLQRDYEWQPVDLVRHGPMLSPVLIRSAADKHLIQYKVHHIASDYFSDETLSREIRSLYDAYSKGEELALPELPIQYADYAVWQRSWLQGEVLERYVGYWRKQLAGIKMSHLPIDYPRQHEPTFGGATQHIQINSALVEQVKNLDGQRVTAFMALVAGIKATLHRYEGEEDIAITAVISGRSKVETEGLVGLFANLLLLRTNLRGDPTVVELFQQVKDSLLEASVYQDMPFYVALEAEIEAVAKVLVKNSGDRGGLLSRIVKILPLRSLKFVPPALLKILPRSILKSLMMAFLKNMMEGSLANGSLKSILSHRTRDEIEFMISLGALLLKTRPDFLRDFLADPALKNLSDGVLEVISAYGVDRVLGKVNIGSNNRAPVAITFSPVPDQDNEPQHGITEGEIEIVPFFQDLILCVAENNKGLSITACYNRNVFKSETIRRFLMDLEHVLEAFRQNPQRRLSELKSMKPMPVK
jgi:NAD(P)-dependent dehydrogenase (short-subunit alcohol dehydrogenase family)